MNKYASIGAIFFDLLNILMKEQNPTSSSAESIWNDVSKNSTYYRFDERLII